jgi:uncharacterized SAM-binding protein YcdF (DUF218 family)
VSRFLSRLLSLSKSRTARAFLSGVLAVLLAWALVSHTPLPELIANPLVLPNTAGTADAIVVLGAGVDRACAPDFHSMRRTIHAARPFKKGKAPLVLFTGGTPPNRSCAIADVMAGLARELGVPQENILVERASSTTWENAVEASKILGPRGIRKVLLVSDSLHMRRGEACIRRFGFDVLRDAVPTVDAYYDGVDLLKDALHEYVGWWYYRLRGRF